MKLDTKNMLVMVSVILAVFLALHFTPYAHRGEENARKKLLEKLQAALPGHDTPLRDVVFVVFDTETTGVNPSYDRLVEIAAVKVDGLKIVGKKGWLVNPEQEIPAAVQKIHGISPEMVKDQPLFSEVYEEFVDYISGCVLIAHNANFDVRFVSSEVDRAGLVKPPNACLDSLPIYRKMYPGLESYSLKTIALHLGFSEGMFHRAEDDAVFTGQILIHTLKLLPENATLGDLIEQAGKILPF